MAEFTENLGLEKPEITDKYDIEKFNSNSDKIDKAVGDLQTRAAAEEHKNRSVLDGITSTAVSNWNSAVSAKHTHSNKSALDKILDDDTDDKNAQGGILLVEPLRVTGTSYLSDVECTEVFVEKRICLKEEGSADYSKAAITAEKVQNWDKCITDDNFNSKNPTKGYNSLDDLATDTADAFEAVQALTRYDETPQEIGAWINGKPVWRQAFHHKFTADEISDIKNDGYWQLWNYISIKDVNKVFVLNHSATMTPFEDNPCVIDDYPLTPSDSGLTVAINPDWFINDTPGIYGYIEFVTPADNIKEA